MVFDCQVPQSLVHVQQWMGKKLVEPLDGRESDEEECGRYLAQHPGLKAHERMDLYRKLYWHRLYKVLAHFYPFLLRLVGVEAFEKTISQPYLFNHPPAHWDLNRLADLLPQWIADSYNGKDKERVVAAASLDLAYHRAFVAEEKEPLSEIVTRKQHLYLQPHIGVLSMEADLFHLREECLRFDVEHWTNRPLPHVSYGKQRFFVFYRTSLGIVREEICEMQYLLLKMLQNGTTLEELATFTENQREELYASAATHLQEWFSTWTRNGWLRVCL